MFPSCLVGNATPSSFQKYRTNFQGKQIPLVLTLCGNRPYKKAAHEQGPALTSKIANNMVGDMPVSRTALPKTVECCLFVPSGPKLILLGIWFKTWQHVQGGPRLIDLNRVINIKIPAAEIHGREMHRNNGHSAICMRSPKTYQVASRCGITQYSTCNGMNTTNLALGPRRLVALRTQFDVGVVHRFEQNVVAG